MNRDVLEKYRVKKGLNKSELARKVGRTPGWYTHLLKGKAQMPTDMVPKLAEVFGVKPEKLAKELFSDSKLE